jgi:hypothetical protein
MENLRKKESNICILVKYKGQWKATQADKNKWKKESQASKIK